jgi:hypothetical protein
MFITLLILLMMLMMFPILIILVLLILDVVMIIFVLVMKIMMILIRHEKQSINHEAAMSMGIHHLRCMVKYTYLYIQFTQKPTVLLNFLLKYTLVFFLTELM